ELGGEPIEQLGVSGQRAHLAEIVGGGDDPAAKVPGPDAIDHDAGGEWIVRPSEPEGQGLAAAEGAGKGGVLAGLLCQDHGKGRLHFFFRPTKIAATQLIYV